MNHSENDITLVEKYFDAELSESEMKHFAQRVESDDSFKTLVEQEKALIGAVRYHAITENLQFLEHLESNLNGQGRKVTRPLKTWYLYAAAATIGIIVVARLFLTSFNETPDELFAAYFKPYPNVFEPTLRGENRSDSRTEAFQAYEQGDYQKAAALFTELLKSGEEPGILLLLGNSNLILGNLDEAKVNFTTLNKDYDELDIQSKWYLSLCYLKSGDIDRARNMLRELGETEISYATKAKELLEKVK